MGRPSRLKPLAVGAAVVGVVLLVIFALYIILVVVGIHTIGS